MRLGECWREGSCRSSSLFAPPSLVSSFPCQRHHSPPSKIISLNPYIYYISLFCPLLHGTSKWSKARPLQPRKEGDVVSGRAHVLRLLSFAFPRLPPLPSVHEVHTNADFDEPPNSYFDLCRLSVILFLISSESTVARSTSPSLVDLSRRFFPISSPSLLLPSSPRFREGFSTLLPSLHR